MVLFSVLALSQTVLVFVTVQMATYRGSREVAC